MGDKDKLISDESVEAPQIEVKKETNARLPWYFASGFLVFWGLLFFAVVIPFFYRLPTPLTLEDAQKNVFITERAYKNLYVLANVGNKLTGSEANEIDAVKFIVNELEDIKANLQSDYFELEIDVSQASGSFPYSTMLNTYQGVQNIAAKLSPKNSTSLTYLLINSHFDSKPYTNSAGDAGFMIVAMLESLRVIATKKQPIENPIVFLFNGAEEGMMQASHGFVTQHKWAPYCKAVLNLDAAGSGGRDILFQSGPNNPWLMTYYSKYIKHPFATTLGEEIFQLGIIPSDTDFRNFRDYGHIPGLDMAQFINGYIYHTKYDLIDVIPRAALQNTGDNILSLLRGFANATELQDTTEYATGHVVFFDFLGIYFFHYTEATGQSLNYGVAGAAIILVFVSIWRIAAVSHVSICNVFGWFSLVLVVQLVSFALGFVFPIVVAYGMDSLGLSLTYFSTLSLVVGLYVVPSLIGLALPITIYYNLQRNDKIAAGYHLQLALHGQAIILAILSIALTVYGLRSAYIPMIPLLFYVISLGVNLLTTLHDRGFAWTGLLKLSQIIPFLYSSYLIYLMIIVLTPMGGRAGSATNRDLYIAVLAALGTVLSFGFLIPLINTFRRPSLVILSLFAITAVSVYLAGYTQLGFPYRPKTNGQRVAYLQVRNMFYEYDGTLSKDESGYLFSYQDRRKETPYSSVVNLTGLVSIASNCEEHMMCGMPLYDYRYVNNRLQSKWLPRSEPIVPPGISTLELLNKTIVNETTVRFEFNMTGPSHMSLFIQPYEDVQLSNWSFAQSYLEDPPAGLPYHIYFVYGINTAPLNFFLEFTKSDGDFNVPLTQLGHGSHWVLEKGDLQSQAFAATFPSFTILAEWPALYKRYIY